MGGKKPQNLRALQQVLFASAHKSGIFAYSFYWTHWLIWLRPWKRMCKLVFQPFEDTAFCRNVSSDWCQLSTNATRRKTELVSDAGADAHSFRLLVAFSKRTAINPFILKCKILPLEMTYPQEMS